MSITTLWVKPLQELDEGEIHNHFFSKIYLGRSIRLEMFDLTLGSDPGSLLSNLRRRILSSSPQPNWSTSHFLFLAQLLVLCFDHQVHLMFTLCHLFVNLQLFSHLHLYLLHLPYPLGPPENPSYSPLHEALSTFLHLISILIVHLTQSWLISTRTCVSTRPRQNFTTSQQDEVTSTCAFRNKHHHTILP